MDRNAEAIESFNKHAGLYNEMFGGLSLYNDTYDLFSTLLPARYSSVLDLGCGPGNISSYLLHKRADLKITGIDLAPNMIEIAGRNNPSGNFKVMDCREVKSLNTKYDAIISGFTIPYLNKEETEKLLCDCASMLNPEGVFYFSLIDGRYEDSGYQYASNKVDRSYVYYYSSVKIMGMLERCGLKIVQIEDLQWQRKEGRLETHLVFIVRK